MKVTNKKVLVFGSGLSGTGAVGLLTEHGADVVLYDGNEKLDKAELAGRVGIDVQIILGPFPEELLQTLDIVVLSPGVPTDLPVVRQMFERGIEVIGEVELAYAFGKGDVLAITGTNGKTTTTSLLGEIMKNDKEEVYVVGNIGNPYTVAAGEMSDNAVAVAEMSSFQLESIVSFRPAVSALLNISPDHLNRHHTMEAYIEAKKNIARNQTEDDWCILNYEDEVTRELINYSGDNMNVKMAVKMAKRQGITVKTVVANDDVASAPKEQREKRRGVAGEVLMWKVGGAKAAAGGSLDEVIAVAQKAIDNTRSVGIGLTPCTLPAVGHPN